MFFRTYSVLELLGFFNTATCSNTLLEVNNTINIDIHQTDDQQLMVTNDFSNNITHVVLPEKEDNTYFSTISEETANLRHDISRTKSKRKLFDLLKKLNETKLEKNDAATQVVLTVHSIVVEDNNDNIHLEPFSRIVMDVKTGITNKNFEFLVRDTLYELVENEFTKTFVKIGFRKWDEDKKEYAAEVAFNDLHVLGEVGINRNGALEQESDVFVMANDVTPVPSEEINSSEVTVTEETPQDFPQPPTVEYSGENIEEPVEETVVEPEELVEETTEETVVEPEPTIQVVAEPVSEQTQSQTALTPEQLAEYQRIRQEQLNQEERIQRNLNRERGIMEGREEQNVSREEHLGESVFEEESSQVSRMSRERPEATIRNTEEQRAESAATQSTGQSQPVVDSQSTLTPEQLAEYERLRQNRRLQEERMQRRLEREREVMARRQAEQERLRQQQEEQERLRQQQEQERLRQQQDAEQERLRQQQDAEQRRVHFQDQPPVTPPAESTVTPPVVSTPQTRHFTSEEMSRINRLNESEAAHRERMNAQLEERRQELERRRQEQLASGEISQAQNDFEEQQRRINEENERFAARRRTVMNELEQRINPSNIQQEPPAAPPTRAVTEPNLTDEQFAQELQAMEFQDVPTNQVMPILDEIVNEELGEMLESEYVLDSENVVSSESEAFPSLTEEEINGGLEGQTNEPEAMGTFVPPVETSTAEAVFTGRTESAQPVRVTQPESERVTEEPESVTSEPVTPEPSTTTTTTTTNEVVTTEKEPMSDNKKLAIILGSISGAIILTGLSVATYNFVKKRNSRTKPDAEYSISTQQ